MSQIAVAFHLTHQCNLRCDYCYTGEKLNLPMNRATAAAGIELSLAEAQRRQATHLDITFFGGEPLIEMDLLCFIADQLLARTPERIVLNMKLSTNGTLLTKERLQSLNQRKIYVSLSVDGPPEIHDRQRKNAAGKGTSAAVIAAAKRLLKQNPCANVTCVLQPDTADYADECIDFLFGLGFRYFNLTLNYSANWTLKDMNVLEKAYRRVADWYEARTLEGATFYLSSFDERIKSHTLVPATSEEKCSLGKRQISIAPDGAIYPCLQFVTTEGLPEFMIGHVLKGGLQDDCRQHISSCASAPKEECSGCKVKSRCGSWCACINYASTGTITAASPVLCYYERRILPVVDELAAKLYRRRSRRFLHKHYNPDYPLLDYAEQLAEAALRE